jgi:hypothetical protein
MSDQLHALTALPQEKSGTDGRVSRRIGYDHLAKRKILPLAGFEPWSAIILSHRDL